MPAMMRVAESAFNSQLLCCQLPILWL